MTTYEPPPGTIPHKTIAWLRSMAKARRCYEPSTVEICDGIGVDTEGFTAYMRPARERGLVHTRKSKTCKVLHWRLGDGTPDPTLGPQEREEAPQAQKLQQIAEPFKPMAGPLFPAPQPDFRALEWEGHLLVTGMAIRDGVAIFTPDQVQALKLKTDWWVMG